MLFNSYIFIFIFLPVMLIGYFALQAKNKQKLAELFLLCMSMWFCSYLNIFYTPILIGSIIFNYVIGRLLQKNAVEGHVNADVKAKSVFICGLIVNIGLLFFFKYYNFFIDSINSVFKADIPFLKLILPLGISFYTFSGIAYIYDVYKNRCENYNFLEYALYVSYFPKLIEGPITLHNDLIPQLRDNNRWKVNYENLSKGMFRFALGLTKKVLVADNLALLADEGFKIASYTNGATALVTVLAYSLQIYFDFSGYCDMAIGISKMLNIDLTENFNSPYRAENITDFWDRWHISLTKFFTRYLYIPLGGNRKGNVRTYINVLIVFLISGLWHGANWTFVIWGLAYGVLMVAERIIRDVVKSRSECDESEKNRKAVNEKKNTITKVIKTFITFLAVTILWSLFRADSFKDFIYLMWAIISFPKGGVVVREELLTVAGGILEISFIAKFIPSVIKDSYPAIALVVFEIIGLAVAFFFKNTAQLEKEFKPNILRLIITMVMIVYCILSLSNVTQFIYSNF